MSAALVDRHAEISTQAPIAPPSPSATASDGDPIPGLEDRSVADEALIEPVESLAATIEPELANAPPEIQSQLETWADLHGLSTTLDEATREVIAMQAAVSLLLKATLYEWHHRRSELPALSGDTRAAFQAAASQLGNSAFDECVLDDIISLTDSSDRDIVVDERTRLMDSTQPAEDIGWLYEAVVPREHRQTLGQFRTSPALADLVQSWATSGGDRVLDPGVGAGSLSSPLHPDWDLSTEPDHVDGVDRSPLSVLMSTTALTLLGQSHDPYQADFFDLQPDDLREPVNAIVANPPFAQGSSLRASYKQRVNAYFEDVTGIEISAQSPLYAYFMFHARTAFLSVGERAGFVTPWNFLATQYGTALKAFLRETCSIEAFVKFDTDVHQSFSNADTTTLVTCVEARAEADSPGTTRFIRVEADVDEGTIREAIRDGQQGATEWGYINVVEQDQLSPAANWQTRFNPVPIDTNSLPTLSEFCSVNVGKSCGKVGFFCLAQSDVTEYGIDAEHLSLLVRKPSIVDGYDFTDDDWTALRAADNPVWLLDPDELPSVPRSVHEYSAQVEAGTASPQNNEGLHAYLWDGVAEGNLTGVKALDRRTYWYRPVRQPAPRVVVQYCARDEFRFILNETDARILNSAYGLYDVTLDDQELKAVLAYLHSSVGQQVIQRVAGARQGDLSGFGVTDLRDLPVIDPRELDDETVAELADAFDNLCTAARCDGDTEGVRGRIETVLQRGTDIQ
ncbi:Eco57I restriction-modification methylase domain-containing protein [Halobacterium salinarum]|uniref:Eco57I restriction-modification methylase domain-containing protein n=1 Tax=Halobacterium salinarum TaxID=2242 RepID=UPI00390493F7